MFIIHLNQYNYPGYTLIKTRCLQFDIQVAVSIFYSRIV